MIYPWLYLLPIGNRAAPEAAKEAIQPLQTERSTHLDRTPGVSVQPVLYGKLIDRVLMSYWDVGDFSELEYHRETTPMATHFHPRQGEDGR